MRTLVATLLVITCGACSPAGMSQEERGRLVRATAAQLELNVLATAQETYFTAKSAYAASLDELRTEVDYEGTAGVEVRVVWANDRTYCLESLADGVVRHLDASREGDPVDGPCPTEPA